MESSRRSSRIETPRTPVAEPVVKQPSLAWLEATAWQVAQGLDIAPAIHTGGRRGEGEVEPANGRPPTCNYLTPELAISRPASLQSADAVPCVLPTAILALSRRKFSGFADTEATLAHGQHARTDRRAWITQ